MFKGINRNGKIYQKHVKKKKISGRRYSKKKFIPELLRNDRINFYTNLRYFFSTIIFLKYEARKMFRKLCSSFTRKLKLDELIKNA